MAISEYVKKMEMFLGVRVEPKFSALANFTPIADPFPEIYNNIQTAKAQDLFTFIFRQTAFMDKNARATSNAPKYSNVVFRMPLNPSKETRVQAKNMTFTLTDGGYVTTNWGNGLINLSFSGTTGRLIPEDDYSEAELIGRNAGAVIPNKPLGVRDTKAWKVFMKFNYFYQYFNGGNEFGWSPDDGFADFINTPRTAQVVLSFWDKVYVGALTNFQYDVDANDPWQVKYSFNFVSLPIQEKIGGRTPVFTLGDPEAMKEPLIYGPPTDMQKKLKDSQGIQ